MSPRRIRLTLAYDGTEFHGWQVQPGLPTIQGLLEDVFGAIEGAPVHVEGSGRTDAGVHALAQVAAISLTNPIPLPNLRKAVNRLLPHSIRLLDCQEVEPSFHPRFDAARKTYEYRIYRGEICPPFQRRYLHHHPYPMRDDWFCACAPAFVGEFDFRAFCASDERYEGEAVSMTRRIFASSAERNGDLLIYSVTGSGFLKHMVRHIVGTLFEAGKGNTSTVEIQDFLHGRREGKAGPSVPASGLFLVCVEY